MIYLLVYFFLLLISFFFNFDIINEKPYSDQSHYYVNWDRTTPLSPTNWPHKILAPHAPKEEPVIKFWYPQLKDRITFLVYPSKRLTVDTYFPDLIWCWRYSANFMALFRIYRTELDDDDRLPPSSEPRKLVDFLRYLATEHCYVRVFCEYRRRTILLSLTSELVDSFYIYRTLVINWDPDVVLEKWHKQLDPARAHALYSIRIEYFWVSPEFNPFLVPSIKKLIMEPDSCKQQNMENA